MMFSVTKLAPALVGPREQTPAGNLSLSSIDLTPALRDVMVDSIHVFQHGVEPARVIREALSRALVPYYPVAGRLLKCDDGDMVVACTGEGVWFVEATTNFSLKDVDNLQRPLMIPKEEFLPVLSPDVSREGVIFMLQMMRRETNCACRKGKLDDVSFKGSWVDALIEISCGAAVVGLLTIAKVELEELLEAMRKRNDRILLVGGKRALIPYSG